MPSKIFRVCEDQCCVVTFIPESQPNENVENEPEENEDKNLDEIVQETQQNSKESGRETTDKGPYPYYVTDFRPLFDQPPTPPLWPG